MSQTKHIYISGPMTGLPEKNFPAFNAKAKELFLEGHIVLNPANCELKSLNELMNRFTDYLCTEATHIYMLKGWEKSKGALAEYHLAVCLGLEIMFEDGAEKSVPTVTDTAEHIEKAINTVSKRLSIPDTTPDDYLALSQVLVNLEHVLHVYH